jgi:hypothetical protein
LFSVNVRIGSVQIAQGTLETIWSRLEDRPLISFVAMRRDCHGETQFEGHVESWHAPEGVIRRVVLGDELTVLRFSGAQRVFSSCDEPGIAVVAAQEALGERAQLA